MAPVKVLVVADGIFSFGVSLDDTLFTLNFVIGALKETVDISVDTAHRAGDTKATIKAPFNFATSIPDLAAYDELWLFGYEGSNDDGSNNLPFISEEELTAISVFMDNGGGVLATGDHSGLGSAMCGLIPRVRSMRKWFDGADTDPRIPSGAPPNYSGAGPTRADTLVLGEDGQWNFDNQSDDVPQKLSFPGGYVHPILYGSAGPINTFPDHMHEGEVLGFGGITGPDVRTPWALDAIVPFGSKSFVEYPTVNGHQEVPTIIATGTVTGGHPTLVETNGVRQCESQFSSQPQATNGNQINTLSVYDGHTVGVGRILTDSSFHHYLDLNLTGDHCSTGAKTQGFTTLTGAPYLLAMGEFYVNTARWLAGPQPKSLTCLTTDGIHPIVLYTSANSPIKQAIWGPSPFFFQHTWTTTSLPSAPVQIGSTLASLVLGPQEIRLYYIDATSHINELSWNGSTWSNKALPSVVARQGSALTCFATTSLHVYYVDFANRLNELIQPIPTASSSSWTNTILPNINQVRPSSPLSSFSLASSEPRLYYIDTQDRINEAAFVSGKWINTVLPANNPLSLSAPLANLAHRSSGLTAFAANSSRDSRVYYIDTLARLNALNWTGDRWENDVFDNPGPAGAITAAQRGCVMASYNASPDADLPHVFYFGNEDEVREQQPLAGAGPGRWQEGLLGDVLARQPGSMGIVELGAAGRGDAGVQVFFVGADERIYVAGFDETEGGWSSSVVG